MRFAPVPTSLVVALAAGSMLSAGASGATSSCTTVISGTSASETLTATASSTKLLGLEGDDRISGSPGPDCIDGGPGNDRIAGLGGADTLEGAAGNDLLTGGSGADVLLGGMGADKLSGGPGADRLSDVAEAYADLSLAATRNRLAAGPGPDRLDTANGRPDVVHCGAGRDMAIADREDRLAGCERKRFLRSPLPQAAPRAGGRARMFMVRFRALEEVASHGEQFSITVNGPAGCGAIETSSLGIRYRPGATVRYRLKPFARGGKSARRWCRGLYRGTVDFVRDPGPAIRIGRFSFRVR
jgi:hypothetical protein